MQKSRSIRADALALTVLGFAFLSSVEVFAQRSDPGCESYEAWQVQINPRTDATGINNHGLPDYNATYWRTDLSFPAGTVLSIEGQYPSARYVSFQVYDSFGFILSSINDANINPDPGQNNPFVGGSAQGNYKVRLVFGPGFDQVFQREPNTLHTGGRESVRLFYRVYYSNDPNSLPGGPVDPVLPNIVKDGVTFSSCPPRPILPEEATLAGRLDDIDYIGTPPPGPIAVPPGWQFWVGTPITEIAPFFANHNNGYAAAIIDRTFLRPPYNFDMAVIRMKIPTFTDTQAGVPPYTPANVRYWSICQNEVLTLSVVRCVPDNMAATLDGFATFVISDPSERPSDVLLKRWGATWLPWGALQPNDVIYGVSGNAFTNADPVFYYGLILYRQTLADAKFAQSIKNMALVRPRLRQAAMGDYWPTLGYCRTAAFVRLGGRCVVDEDPQE